MKKLMIGMLLVAPVTTLAMGMNNNNNNNNNNTIQVSEQTRLIGAQQSQESNCNCLLCCVQCCYFPCLAKQEYEHERERRDALHQKELALIRAATAAVSKSNSNNATIASPARSDNDESDLNRGHRECTGSCVCTWIACWPILSCLECCRICRGYVSEQQYEQGDSILQQARYKRKVNDELRALGYKENTKRVAETVKSNRGTMEYTVWAIFPNSYVAIE